MSKKRKRSPLQEVKRIEKVEAIINQAIAGAEVTIRHFSPSNEDSRTAWYGCGECGGLFEETSDYDYQNLGCAYCGSLNVEEFQQLRGRQLIGTDRSKPGGSDRQKLIF